MPLKIPSKVPAKAGYTSQTCPHTGTAVPGTFAPLTTINLFAKHQLPAPASPLVAASTSPHQLQCCPLPLIPSPDWSQQDKILSIQSIPTAPPTFSRSGGGTGGLWEAARLHVAAAEVCEHILPAKTCGREAANNWAEKAAAACQVYMVAIKKNIARLFME